jgi:hypothetical protein
LSESHLAALMDAVSDRLGEGGEPWGARFYKDLAPQGTARPYVTYMFAGGGPTYEIRASTPSVLLQVKAVADNQEDAYECMERIRQLLVDADYDSAKELDGGADWWINTTREDVLIDFTELIEQSKVIRYHAGLRIRVSMQAKQEI